MFKYAACKYQPTNPERLFDIPSAHVHNVLDSYETPEERLSVCTEECSELIKAISKHNRAVQNPKKYSVERARASIVEELTHVAICLGMLREMFGIRSYEIDQEVRRKVEEAHFDDSKYQYLVTKFYDAGLNLGEEDALSYTKFFFPLTPFNEKQLNGIIKLQEEIRNELSKQDAE